jgi:hypothetical protein
MSGLENFKDVRTIASFSALIAVGVSSSYFLSEISKLKEEQEIIKKHLSAIIPYASPDIAKRLELAMKDIQVLDSRVGKAVGDIEVLSKYIADEQPKKVYERLTKKTDANERMVKPTFASRRAVPPVTVAKQETSDLEDDIAAMK